MKDLIRSEWRRFRRIALVAALVHGFALLLMSRAFEVQHAPSDDAVAILVVYMLLALTLAFLQIGSYRHTSRWLWLIHRPIPPAQIFGAMALSALALLSVAIVAPLLIFLGATHALTTQVVDIRHYVTVFLALAFTMMAWLAGAHAITARSKAAVAVLLAPLILTLHMASVWWLLVPVLVCVAWLAFIARFSFRADRDAPIARHSVLLLTALPLQLGFFLLVFQLTKTSVALVDLLGRGPGRTVLSSDTTVDVAAMMRSMGQNHIAKGLENSRDPRVTGWREQLPLLEVAQVTPNIDRFPVRHQFGNVADPWWDNRRNIKWTFSHDRMLFRGRDALGGKPRGWWGTGGLNSTERFAEVPASAMTRNVLYTRDEETQQQHEMVRLPEGEWFMTAPVNALDRVLLQTNKRLLAYRPDRDAVSQFAPPVLDWAVPLSADQPPPHTSVVELLDGWLISMFYFDEREFDGFTSLTSPWQQVMFVDADGKMTVVGERRNIRDHQVSALGPAAIPASSWWVSPPLYALAHIPDAILKTGVTQPSKFIALPPVPLFHVIALVLMLASIAAGYLWLRGTRVRTSRRNLWLASCAVLGVPAFLSLVCLEPRVPKH